MDTINNTIQETDSAYSSYSPIYFIVNELIIWFDFGDNTGFLLVTILAQNNIVYPKNDKGGQKREPGGLPCRHSYRDFYSLSSYTVSPHLVQR